VRGFATPFSNFESAIVGFEPLCRINTAVEFAVVAADGLLMPSRSVFSLGRKRPIAMVSRLMR
jgi:hypothetical protein